MARLTNYRGQDGGADWSPKGKQIAYDSRLGGRMEIYVMHSDGSQQMSLTNQDGERPAWSPDGRYIIFTGPDGLYVMNADGSSITRLPIQGVSSAFFSDWTQ